MPAHRKPDWALTDRRRSPKDPPAPRCQFYTEVWCGPDGLGCSCPAIAEIHDGHGNTARCCLYHQTMLRIQPAATAAGLGLIWDGYPEGEDDDE